jgi:hypothetical protein
MNNRKETTQRRGQHNQAPVFNDKLQQSLRSLLNTNIRRQNPVSNSVRNADTMLPHIDFIGEEGVDHINVSRHGRTELGKLLAMESPLSVEVPGLGAFASIAGLWYFLSNPSDSKYIQLPGAAVYAHGRKCEKHPKLEARSRLVVAYAVWLMVLKYPDIQRALRELPPGVGIDCYAVKYNNQKPELSRMHYSTWYVYVINQIREALKGGAVFPDFSRLSFLPKAMQDVHDEETYVKMIASFINRAILPVIEAKKQEEAARAEVPVATAAPIEGAPEDQEEDVNLAPPPVPPLVPTPDDLAILNQEEPAPTPQPVNDSAPQAISTAPQSLVARAEPVTTDAVEQ